jgi:hypothetical protein
MGGRCHGIDQDFAANLRTRGSAVYDAAATAALHDATRLAFDYLVSSSDTPTSSLAVTGLDPHGAIVADLAGNHATITTVAAALSALSINEAVADT